MPPKDVTYTAIVCAACILGYAILTFCSWIYS